MSTEPADTSRHSTSVAPGPTWSTWREALAVVAEGRQLRRSMLIAPVVGTLLFVINQLDVVLRGDATVGVWVKAALTYLVPFCVANAGLLSGTRRGAPELPDDSTSTDQEPEGR